MGKQKHIIFDLDGTIIDSKNEILKTYNIVFNEIAPKVFPDLKLLNYGLTLQSLLKGVYGADEEDKLIKAKQRFVSIYDSSDFKETKLYEGVSETLHFLKENGCELYIATNKRLSPTIRILEIKGIKQLFSSVMANEMQPGFTLTKQQMIAELKNKYLFSEGFMVGDSVSDILAGKEEKLITIAVNYGYEHPDLLVAKNPDFTTDYFGNLSTFVL
jgi:phosphoglycolate phosphatase